MRAGHRFCPAAFALPLTLASAQAAPAASGAAEIKPIAAASSRAAAAVTSAAAAAATQTSAPTTAPPAPAAATQPNAQPRSDTCIEHIPTGKARPEISESFPSQGVSGHRATLKLSIQHGRGERVLPGALTIQTEGEAARALKRAGFLLPDVKGPARPRLRTEDTANGSITEVSISVIPLPKEAGRHELTLPPLPIAMARASGEVITLCTESHVVSVEDPIANEPLATPKPNPPPHRQPEQWQAMRNAVYGIAMGLLLAGLLALGYQWWRRRPKKVAPAPPARPAWELALEALYDIRRAGLVEQGRLHDHFDRVSYTLKEYLGRRFDFDGLESTSEEILSQMRSSPDAAPALSEVQQFLSETDLVKFANLEPTEAQCLSLIERAESVVRGSTPVAEPAKPAAEHS